MIVLYSLSWISLRRHNKKIIRVYESNYRCTTRRDSAASNCKLDQENTKWNTEHESRLSTWKRKFSNNDAEAKYRSLHSIIRRRQIYRTLRMFVAVIAVFAVFMLPNQITWFYSMFGEALDSSVETLFLFLTYTNTVLNPWIYWGTNPRYRRAYKMVLIKMYNNFIGAFCPPSVESRVRYTRKISTTATDYMMYDRFQGNGDKFQGNGENGVVQRKTGLSMLLIGDMGKRCTADTHGTSRS